MNQIIALRPQGCPPGIDPREWRLAVELRIEELHDTLLALIGAVDRMDGDPELEPSLGAAEIPPSLSVRGGLYGWLSIPGSQASWSAGADDDGEEDDGDAVEAVNEDGDELEGDDGESDAKCDDEETLGWANPDGWKVLNGHADQEPPPEGWSYEAFGTGGDGDA